MTRKGALSGSSDLFKFRDPRLTFEWVKLDFCFCLIISKLPWAGISITPMTRCRGSELYGRRFLKISKESLDSRYILSAFLLRDCAREERVLALWRVSMPYSNSPELVAVMCPGWYADLLGREMKTLLLARLPALFLVFTRPDFSIPPNRGFWLHRSRWNLAWMSGFFLPNFTLIGSWMWLYSLQNFENLKLLAI